MTTGLAALLERADNEQYPSFNRADLERWGLEPAALPFIAPTSTPATIECPGCEWACVKPIGKRAGKVFIWCDEAPDLGRIRLEEKDLRHWQVNMSKLAGMLAQETAREIVPGRVYDIGLLEGHTLFLLRGTGWEDGEALCKDTHICNAHPLLITLSSPPEEMAVPIVWIGQVLSLKENGPLGMDTGRLVPFLSRVAITDGNVFRQLGKQWRICHRGKEIFMPDIKGMTYIQQLLYSPQKSFLSLELQALHGKSDAQQSYTGNSASDVLDKKTIQSVMQKILLLQKNNPGSPELPQLQEYLRKATYGGKSTSFTNAQEKARTAVASAIKRSITAIEKSNSALASHLKCHIKGGTSYSYNPDTNIRWT